MKKCAANPPFATFMQPLQCDFRLSDAKQTSIMLAAAAARNLDAAIPLRSADTELPSTIELRTTAPTNCSDLQLSTPKRKKKAILKHFLKGILKEKKSSMPKWKKICCPSTVRAFVRGFLRIPTVEEVKTKLSCDASFKFQEFKKWTHLFNAAVRMHRVSQHMQYTIAQHHQRREKVTWNHQFHCAAQFENISTLRRRRPKPSRKQANFSPQRKLHLPEKTPCFVEILTFKSHPGFVKTKLSCEVSFEFKSWRCENEAFVRCFLQVRLYPTLDSSPLYSTLLNSTQLYSAQVYSTQLYSTLVYPTLLNSTQLYSAQLYSTLLCST